MKEITLASGAVALVDDENYEELVIYKWRELKKKYTSYAIRSTSINGKQSSIYMHTQIMNTPKGMETHHINEKGLDNQKDNLVILSRAQHRKFGRKTGPKPKPRLGKTPDLVLLKAEPTDAPRLPVPVPAKSQCAPSDAPSYYVYPYFFRDKPLRYRLLCRWQGKLRHVGYFGTFIEAESAQPAHTALISLVELTALKPLQ